MCTTAHMRDARTIHCHCVHSFAAVRCESPSFSHYRGTSFAGTKQIQHNCMFCVRCYIFSGMKIKCQKENIEISISPFVCTVQCMQNGEPKKNARRRQINPFFVIYCNDLIFSFDHCSVEPTRSPQCSSEFFAWHKLHCVIAVIIGFSFCGYTNRVPHTIRPFRHRKYIGD